MIIELPLLAHWSVRQKLHCVSSVQFSYVALQSPRVLILVTIELFVLLFI